MIHRLIKDIDNNLSTISYDCPINSYKKYDSFEYFCSIKNKYDLIL